MATKKKAAKKTGAKTAAKKAAFPCTSIPQSVPAMRKCLDEWFKRMEAWSKLVKAELDRMETQCCPHPHPQPSHVGDPPPPPW